MREMPVYLDVCALSRPFDDQAFLRIRLETEAVNLIMSKVLEGYLTLAVSPVHFVEINAIPDTLERIELLSIVEHYGVLLDVDKAMARKRADELAVGDLALQMLLMLRLPRPVTLSLSHVTISF